MHDQYIFSGSLPENASTYVKREADDELYEALLQNKFCYILNSRQSGKSSLRVRIMSRLGNAGVECASIDLSSISIQSATHENWYADLIVKLIDSFALDVDFKDWWEQNQLNSPLLKFGNFLSKMLLTEISENIVIFVDEIDSVLSLNFKTDDFFAFIRSCYNQRVDNPEYNRLTFCLLGVASPSNLIEDKQRTPFNIGKAISLKGFEIHEVEPLERGLRGKFPNPQAVIKEILYWTGGQPFLTQKLCQFMVEESLQENPHSVEQVVKSRIIENWESLDEPEHLRTIRAKILRDEQRAGYLLELYQQVRLAQEQSELQADDTLEQSELQLSGLVVRQHNKLRVYNPIYREIFDQNWIENQLQNLRPYSENFRFWVASGETDESRLLRGKALQEALGWAKDKNLSYQDKQFLSASQTQEREEEIAVLEKEAQLERERKDREAAQRRNQVLADANQTLSQANKKAKQQIRVGSFVLAVTLSLAGICGLLSLSLEKKLAERKNYLKTVKSLTQLAAQVQDEGSYTEAEELFSQAGQSANIDDPSLQMDILYTGISYANQKLKSKKIDEAQNYIHKVKLNPKDNSPDKLQIRVLYLKTQGNLFEEKKEQIRAIQNYKEAFNIWDKYKNNINPFNKELKNKILSSKDIEVIHRELIRLLEKSKGDILQQKVKDSLKEYYYAELGNLLTNSKWEEANRLTSTLMLYLANGEKQGYLDNDNIDSFSCQNLKRIDQLWVSNSDKRFGFSVQKEIWNRLGIRLEDLKSGDDKSYRRFVKTVGWYDDKTAGDSRSAFVSSYFELNERIKQYPLSKGTYPKVKLPGTYFFSQEFWSMYYFFSRMARCGL